MLPLPRLFFCACDKLHKSNRPFAKEVTSAHFYYMDKFLLLTSGNTLHLYKYYIDTSQVDDIKRFSVVPTILA